MENITRDLSLEDFTPRSRHNSPNPATAGYVKTETTTRDIYSNDGSYNSRTLSPPRQLSPQRQTRGTLPRTYNNSPLPEQPYKTTITDVSDNFDPSELSLPLSQDILPNPATKVTTTVRTYTYELPGEPGYSPPLPEDSYVYKVSEPVAPPSSNRTVVYRNESSSHNTTHNVAPPANYYQGPPETNIVYNKDTKHTTTNIQNPPHHYPMTTSPSGTIIYKTDTTNTTHNVHSPPGRPSEPSQIQSYPPQNPGYLPQNQGYPPQQPPSHTTIIYKNDTTNTTTRNVHGPLGDDPNYPQGYQPQNQGYPPQNTQRYPQRA